MQNNLCQEKVFDLTIAKHFGLHIENKKLLEAYYKLEWRNEIVEFIEDLIFGVYKKTKGINHSQLNSSLYKLWKKLPNKESAQLIINYIIGVNEVEDCYDLLDKKYFYLAPWVAEALILEMGPEEFLEAIKSYKVHLDISCEFVRGISKGLYEKPSLSKKDILKIARYNSSYLDMFFYELYEGDKEDIELLQMLSIFWDRAAQKLGRKKIAPQYPDILVSKSAWVEGLINSIPLSSIEEDAHRFKGSISKLERYALYDAHLSTQREPNPEELLGENIPPFEALTGLKNNLYFPEYEEAILELSYIQCKY